VRPILDMKKDGAKKMRAIAEEACALVKNTRAPLIRGSTATVWCARSGSSRSSVRASPRCSPRSRTFSIEGPLEPGKIVRPSKQDDRTLFRFKPGYAAERLDTALDWSDGACRARRARVRGGGRDVQQQRALRKFDAGTMCPSFRATGDERHLTRGRANSLRLALSGQLGPGAFTSDEMYETLDLCVSCKGCRRECPTGVDMAKMKIEFLHHYHARHGYSLKDRLIAYLPRYALWPRASRGRRTRSRRWASALSASQPALPAEVAPLVPELAAPIEQRREGRRGRALRRHVQQLLRTGKRTRRSRRARPRRLRRAYRRGRRRQQRKCAAAVLRPHFPRGGNGRAGEGRGATGAGRARALRGTRRRGRRPRAFLPSDPARRIQGDAFGRRDRRACAQALLFEEFLALEHEAGRLALKLKPLPEKSALVHGHCHQKAFGAMPAVQRTLALVPELGIEMIESSCCGMAGSFGYEAAHHDISMKMAEAALLPKVRAAGADTIIVADGTSCRHQLPTARRERPFTPRGCWPAPWPRNGRFG